MLTLCTPPIDLDVISKEEDLSVRLVQATLLMKQAHGSAKASSALTLTNWADVGGALLIVKEVFKAGEFDLFLLVFNFHCFIFIAASGNLNGWKLYVVKQCEVGYKESTMLIRFHVFQKAVPWIVYCGKVSCRSASPLFVLTLLLPPSLGTSFGSI